MKDYQIVSRDELIGEVQELMERIDELNGRVNALEAAQHGVHLTVCGRCQNPVTEQNVYCPKCGTWNPANRR